MPQTTPDLFASPSLNLKGSLLPLTTLELLYFDAQKFSDDLSEKVQQAPGMFKNLPLVLSLEKFTGDRAHIDYQLLRELCKEKSIQLIALRSDSVDDTQIAEQAGLAILQSGKSKSQPTESSQDETTAEAQSKQENKNEIPSPIVNTNSKIVQTPVRSGQQVYAQGGDLIILAPVSPGAEILADGNVHVYGPLRGRALAGVNGNPEANVFCQSLEAELVSICGHYKLSEDLQGDLWRKPVRIMLEHDEKLSVNAL